MIYPDAVHFDLLDTDLQIKYGKQPSKLRTEIFALDKSKLEYPIIIDEVQKISALMDEIHWLIENTDCYFILCSSSARNASFGLKAFRYKLLQVFLGVKF
jgi:hypothetical protein